MPVNTLHDEYRVMAPVWRKCRDVMEGQEAIHRGKTRYLPRLSGQRDSEYDAYLKRTSFYNATQRTVDGMVGLMFSKKPVIELPTGLDEFVESVDQYGNELTVFSQIVAEEVLITNRVGILVDHPEEAGEEISLGDAMQMNMRPFLCMYPAERIINWRSETINNKKMLVMVVLEEDREIWDEFKRDTIKVYRVLDLLEGAYRQRIFVQDGDKFIMESEVFPRMAGQAMRKIPFFIVSSDGMDSHVAKPPIVDLVNVNLSHYMTTADLEHAAHFTGLPTPVITGIPKQDGVTYGIGSTEAWILGEPDAKAFYMEFSGQGLEALERRREVKERHIATLGARMLVDEKSSAETAEAHQIKRQGENSALASIASAVSDSMAKAISFAAEWMGIRDNIVFEINKDYLPATMDAQLLQGLLMAWQQGAIAFSDLIENLKKGEIINPERNPNDIRAEADAQGLLGLGNGEG